MYAQPPAVQAAISAALLLPTLPAYFFAYRMNVPSWLSWALVLGLEVYFILVVALWSRRPSRRVAAAVVAVVGLGLDRALIALTQYSEGSSPTTLFRISY
ncbi:hypothetical protein [Mycolicibacterium vinylchloridicum]|uniref:hypothetical protein n=1 Tax=Mycolicibacterium vinylchloridicum TaxID=2736928 RepID=UPI0015C9B0D5|nr:hypothetical protein [Mycolicibacterium vinylchloridicum]